MNLLRIRAEIHEFATSNTIKAQGKQKKGFDRRHLSNSEIEVENPILLRNNKRKDRKGGNFSFAWLGPYIASGITSKGGTTLNKQDVSVQGKVQSFTIEIICRREDS